MENEKRKAGRPKGSRDNRPRPPRNPQSLEQYNKNPRNYQRSHVAESAAKYRSHSAPPPEAALQMLQMPKQEATPTAPPLPPVQTSNLDALKALFSQKTVNETPMPPPPKISNNDNLDALSAEQLTPQPKVITPPKITPPNLYTANNNGNNNPNGDDAEQDDDEVNGSRPNENEPEEKPRPAPAPIRPNAPTQDGNMMGEETAELLLDVLDAIDAQVLPPAYEKYVMSEKAKAVMKNPAAFSEAEKREAFGEYEKFKTYEAKTVPLSDLERQLLKPRLAAVIAKHNIDAMMSAETTLFGILVLIFATRLIPFIPSIFAGVKNRI